MAIIGTVLLEFLNHLPLRLKSLLARVLLTEITGTALLVWMNLLCPQLRTRQLLLPMVHRLFPHRSQLKHVLPTEITGIVLPVSLNLQPLPQTRGQQEHALLTETIGTVLLVLLNLRPLLPVSNQPEHVLPMEIIGIALMGSLSLLLHPHMKPRQFL